MRIALVIVFAALLASCGKKKSAQTPSTPSTSEQLDRDAKERDTAVPDDGDDAPTTRTSDPQEGGE